MLFLALPPPEEYLGYLHFNRDEIAVREFIVDFYEEHKLISSRDRTVRRGYYDYERINDKLQMGWTLFPNAIPGSGCSMEGHTAYAAYVKEHRGTVLLCSYIKLTQTTMTRYVTG